MAVPLRALGHRRAANVVAEQTTKWIALGSNSQGAEVILVVGAVIARDTTGRAGHIWRCIRHGEKSVTDVLEINEHVYIIPGWRIIRLANRS